MDLTLNSSIVLDLSVSLTTELTEMESLIIFIIDLDEGNKLSAILQMSQPWVPGEKDRAELEILVKTERGKKKKNRL